MASQWMWGALSSIFFSSLFFLAFFSFFIPHTTELFVNTEVSASCYK